MEHIDILIPTANRLEALIATLLSLDNQTHTAFSVHLSDQSNEINPFDNPTLKTVIRIHELHGRKISLYRNFPKRGIAQQRNFLLSLSSATYVLFLDDDVILEPFILKMLVETIQKEQCGFVGSAVVGLSYIHDIRPQEQKIELWEEPVVPEKIQPGSAEWERYQLHNAANLLHVSQTLHATPDTPKIYKVAWTGGCVLYDREKLVNVGGFSFWEHVPEEASGEDVYVQLKLLAKFGGCGVLPSGAYHHESSTTLPNREWNIPIQWQEKLHLL